MLNLYQYRPAIRLYKWAYALKRMGFDLVITHLHSPVRGINFNEFNIRHVVNTAKERKELKAVLSFNPNISVHTFFRRLPTIQCVGDLVSYGKDNEIEKKNLEAAKACVFVSDIQKAQAIDRYPSIANKSFVVYNGMVDSLLLQSHKPRKEGKKIRIVWSGSLTDKPGHHRVLFSRFDKIASHPNAELHIYPSNGWPWTGMETKAIIHQPVSPYELVAELSQYDYGLILWNQNKEIADCSLPNKLWEYRAAGLSILAEPYAQLLALDQPNMVLSEDVYRSIGKLHIPKEKDRLDNRNLSISYHSQEETILSALGRVSL